MQTELCDMAVRWENGIIGTLENFWKKYPVKLLWRRAQATVFTSLAIPKVELNDQLGPVKANVFAWNLTDSGGYKSPILKALRRLMVQYDKKLILPSKFTVEGLTEQCTGRNSKRDLEDIEATPIGVILRDEVSRILIEKSQKQFGNLFAFLCELWDGWIEGYRTRTYGNEGGVPVFVSMCAASNEHFLKKMEDDDFWIIGLGARINLLDDIEIPFGKYNQDFFESSVGEIIDAEKEVYNRVITMIHKLKREPIYAAMIQPNATDRWVNYEYAIRTAKQVEKDKIKKAQLAKKAQHVLKLGLNYAASRLNVHLNILFIELEDINRAIADSEEFFNATMRIVRKWRGIQTERFTNPPQKISAATKHLQDYMVWIATQAPEGMCSATEVQVQFIVSNVSSIIKILELAKKSEYLEIIAETNDQGKLSDEQYKRFKRAAGFTPKVYGITEKGREYVKNLGVEVLK